MTQFSVLRECALNLSATMPETASADCMPLVNNSTDNAGTSADVFLYLWSHLTCVLFGIQHHHHHQGKSASVSKLVPSAQQSTVEEEAVVDESNTSGCSVDEAGGDEPPARQALLLESSCSSSSSVDVLGSSPKFGREVSPTSPAASGSEYHLSHILGLCEELVQSASSSSEFVVEARRELSSKLLLLQSGDCSLAEDVVDHQETNMSGTEMFETILRKLKKSIRMELETKKQGGGPSSVVCCYSPLVSSTTRGTSEDETSTTTTTITHNNNIINNKIQHHRNVSIMAQMIKSQNQMRRNLKIQISVHQALFKQLAQLAEMDTLSTHPPAVPPSEDNTKLYYSQQMMAPARCEHPGPSDAIPDLLTEVIRGDKHFGPYILRAVKSIILLKASEQRLIKHIAKRQQHSYFHHHGIVDRTGSICSDQYRPFSKDACNSIPRTMPGYAYGPIAMRMGTAAVANTDFGGGRLPPPRQFSFPTEPHVSTEHSSTVHAMRCHPHQEPPSPLIDVAFTKRPITSKGAHATYAPFGYHQNPMYSGHADPGPVPVLGRVCSSYESHIPIPHPAYPTGNAAYHRKPALTTREGLLTSDTAAVDQMMVFDGGSPYVARETFPPGRASQRGLLRPSEQSFSSGSLTASEDSQPNNNTQKSASQHPHRQGKHVNPQQPETRKEDGVTVHHDVDDEELMGIPVDGKRGSSSSSSHHPTKSKGFFGIQQLTKLWKGTKSSGSFFRWSAGIADNQHDTGGRGSQTLCAIDGSHLHHHHHHHLEEEDDSDFLSQRPSHFVSAAGCEVGGGVPPPPPSRVPNVVMQQHHHHHHVSCGIIDNERLSSASTGYCRPTSVVMPTSRKPSKKNTTSHKHMRGASLCEVGTGGGAASSAWQTKDHRNSLFSEDQPPPQLVLQRKSETVVSRRHHHHHHKRKQQQRQRHDNITTVCSSQSKAARARPIKENHAQCHITSTSSTSSSTEESASLQKAQLYFERIPMHFIKCGEDHPPPPQGVIPPHLLFEEPQASLDYEPPPQSPACLYQGYLFNATASSQYGNHLVSPQSWFKQDIISDDETAGSLYPQRSHLAQDHTGSGDLNNLVIGSNNNSAPLNWQSAAQFYPPSNDNSKPALLQPHYSDCVGRHQAHNNNRHYRVYTGGDTTSGGFQRPISPPTVKLMPSSDARHRQSSNQPSPYFPPTNKMGSTYLYRSNGGNSSYHPPPPHMENVNTKRVPSLTSRRKSVQQYEMNHHSTAGMFVYSPHPENLEYLNSPNQLIGNKSARCYSENRRSSFGSEDASRRDIAYCDMAAATERHTDKDIYLISGVSVCSNCPELEGRLTSMNESSEEIVTNRNAYHHQQQQQTYHHHHHPLSEDDQLQQAISRVRAKSGIAAPHHRIIR